VRKVRKGRKDGKEGKKIEKKEEDWVWDEGHEGRLGQAR
jgi:hypothetical protein